MMMVSNFVIQTLVTVYSYTCMAMFLHVEVEIGFSSSEFMANERDEQLNVQVQVKSGLLQKELAFNLHIVELTAHGKELNFVIIFINFINPDGEDFITPETHQFTLNSSQSIWISVPLINDNIFELSESFIVHLTSNVSSGVSLNQSSATVTVLDDDGKSLDYLNICLSLWQQ